jgi:hypothetical protein
VTVQLDLNGRAQSERVCACPCKRSLEGRRRSAVYYSAACRTRAWKERHNIAGIRYVKASQNGKSRSGVQISYYRAFKALTAYTGLDDWEIEIALEAALPERQREVLRERGAFLFEHEEHLQQETA